MRVIADLHIHSKYSRATSRDLDLPHLELWAKIKGLDLLATADFTHPQWFKELSSKLQEAESGLYSLRPEFALPLPEQQKFINQESLARPVRFLLSTEISCIYKEDGKTRRLHLIVWAPNLAAVEKLNSVLEKVGNLKADGRPILGLPAKRLCELIWSVDQNFVVVPAHIWTPWFSVFGSKSGYDSLEECFGQYTERIFALETGLSSDPPMNWRWSKLDNYTLISNSDAHSLKKLGREANVFSIRPEDLSYQEIINILKTKDPKKFLYTIEFFPEEGKYHWDGHRTCQKSYPPSETKRLAGICPVCKKPIVIGVLNRVEGLADRSVELPGAIGYRHLIPLEEIVAEILEKKVGAKAVEQTYYKLIKTFGNELDILLTVDKEQLARQASLELAEAVELMRKEKVEVKPGYDGEFGIVKIGLNRLKNEPKQVSLL